MNIWKGYWQKLCHTASGATAIEYALIAAGISIAIAAIVFTVGSDLTTNLYNNVDSKLK
jgi:Flp pilus assembly pilin Flp